MMGTKARCFTPVPAVSLEELVPADHFYRHLDRVLDLSFVRDLVQDCYAASGRPSVDPVVFFRLQLVMFFEGIRSERLLMRTVTDRLSVRWFLGYNLDEPLPDHSSLTRIRTRYGLAVFRRFFEAIVEHCQHAGLVWGRELYFDATHVLADAAMDSLVPRFAVEARAAIHAHLDALFAEETTPPAPPATPDPEQTEAAWPPTVAAPTALPVALRAPEREQLAAANAARHDWIAEAGRPQREVHGLYQRTADVRISTTDPDATPLHLKGGGTHLGYQTHYAVDGGKKRIILGVLVAPGEVIAFAFTCTHAKPPGTPNTARWRTSVPWTPWASVPWTPWASVPTCRCLLSGIGIPTTLARPTSPTTPSRTSSAVRRGSSCGRFVGSTRPRRPSTGPTPPPAMPVR